MRTLRNQILIGDAQQRLTEIAEDSVDMVLTSPPYFRLRDYRVDGQLGLETQITDWVDALVAVTAELRRVIRPTGTLWLNLGDSYATHHRQGAGRKCLLLGPERLATELTARGWLLRNKIVWQKPNPMPSSVRDRLTCSWEYLYVFASSPSYYFNLDAIRQIHTSPTPHNQYTAHRSPPTPAWQGPNGAPRSGLARLRARGQIGHRLGKNPGDVWRIANRGYRGAHHATFPCELARRAILAGCPPGGLVLDPFLGAGTTAVVAEALGRDWLGVELNPDFVSLANQRLEQARASPAAA